jgi:chromosome segregation ATPase
MGDMTVQMKEPPKGVTFEEAWASIQETSQAIKSLSEETARQMRETGRLIKELTEKTDRQMEETAQQMQETDQRMKETDRQMKETDRQMKKTDRQLGKLGLRLGDVVEHFMSPSLHKKMEALGFRFTRSSRNIEILDQQKQRLAEVDVFLENGEYVMAVEVKTRLSSKDVKDHVKRMGVLRRVADERQDKRKYLGAVAGAVVTPEVLAYALKNGFYTIVPSGKAVDIKVPEGFIPRIW